MSIIYILAIALSSVPYPVFAFITEFKTEAECRSAMEQFDSPNINKKSIGCLRILSDNI